MRINKDIRFSKDKSPYNLLMKANFTPGGRKSGNPGFFLGISATHAHVGRGLYSVTPKDLKQIRGFIAEHPDRLVGILDKPSFKERYGEVVGDRAKRIDKKWMEMAEQLPILHNKQYYYMQQLPIADYLEDDQVNKLKPSFLACQEVHWFFREATSRV